MNVSMMMASARPRLAVRLLAALPAAAVVVGVLLTWTLWRTMDAFTLSGAYGVAETLTQHTATWIHRVVVLVVLGFLPLAATVLATTCPPRIIQQCIPFPIYAAALLLLCLAWAACGTFLTYLLGA